MNTVGKYGRLGDSIRCVESVSMLTEGWDARTVTHVLGVRAFGTQLLCEQVIGRALRRQSYDLNEENLFNVEYADVLGIPFDFTAKPVVAPPQPPRETIQVKAVRPDRDHLEIRFPRLAGYRVELPEERLTAQFNDESVMELTPDLVGPSVTRNEGIIGKGVDLKRCCKIEYRIEEVKNTKEWTADGDALAELAGVDIFDVDSGRLYLSRESEVSYTPRSVGVFNDLVWACEGVRHRLQAADHSFGIHKHPSG